MFAMGFMFGMAFFAVMLSLQDGPYKRAANLRLQMDEAKEKAKYIKRGLERKDEQNLMQQLIDGLTESPRT